MRTISERLMGLRSRIAAIFVAGLLPILAILSWQFGQLIAEQHEVAAKTAESFARDIAERHANILVSTELALLRLKDANAAREGSMPECQTILAKLVNEDKWLTGAWVTDASGRLSCSDRGTQEFFRSDRTDFIGAMQSGEFTVGQYRIGQASGRAVLPVSMPIRNRDGNLVGTFGAAIDTSWIKNIPSSFDNSPVPLVAILDADGTVLYASQNPERFVGKRLPEPVASDVSLKGIRGPSLDGVDRIFSGISLENPDITIWVGIAAEAILRPALAKTQQLALALILSALLGGILVVWGLGRFVTGPIGSLLDAARQIARGEAYSIDTSALAAPGEVGQLSREISTMASELVSRESSLRRSEAFIRSVADNLPVSIAYIDSKRRFRFVNRTAEIWHALPATEILGRTRSELMPSGFSDSPQVDIALAVDGHRTRTEEQILYPDGVARWVEVIRVPDLDERGNVLGYFRMTIDISERRNAERAVRESSDLLNNIIDSTPSNIFAFDLQHRFTLMNNETARFFGKSKEELLGKSLHEIFQKSLADALQADDIQIMATGKKIFQEETIVGRGELRIFMTSKFPLRDTRGNIVGLAGVATDITERKAVEEQLRQAQKMEAVGQLTAGVAHDFNNLLAVVMSNLDLIRLNVHDEEIGQRITAALRATERGAALTRQLLAFGRRAALRPETIDLDTLIRDLAPLLRRTLGETIGVVTKPSGRPACVLLDKNQIDTALINLALNARDAMPRGGVLTVETVEVELDAAQAEALGAEFEPGRYVVVAMSDTGVGMTSEVAARAFEPFFTTKDVGHGSGLGLAMVYGFVKQSGGHARIYSEPGHGTSVKLYFPVAERIGETAQSSTRGEPSAEPRGHERILLVEDDAAVRDAIAHLLASLGYEVLQAADGPKALAAIEHGTAVDLVLCDIILTGPMTGPETAGKLRGFYPGLKVVFMSGYPGGAAMNRQEATITDRLLQKPVGRDELARVIREELGADAA